MYYGNEIESLQRSRVGIGKWLTSLDLSCHILYRKHCKLMRKRGPNLETFITEKEMKNVMPAFGETGQWHNWRYSNGKKGLVIKEVFCSYCVFDTSKSEPQGRFVADEMEDGATSFNYSSECSIPWQCANCILIAIGLNDLNVLSADLQNAYLNDCQRRYMLLEVQSLVAIRGMCVYYS